MRRFLTILTLVAVTLFGGFPWPASGDGGHVRSLIAAAHAQDAPAPTAEIKIPDMILGNADAPLTVTEYASFTCPHCRDFHETVFPEFKTNYIDTGKVRFVYREVYFDKFGLWAAMLARCGGEMKYFGIADMLYRSQKEWIADGQEQTIFENLRKIGLQAGIAPDALDACLKNNDVAKAMVAVYQSNAQADGVEATPTFFIGDDKTSGAMSYADFAALLDAKLPQ